MKYVKKKLSTSVHRPAKLLFLNLVNKISIQTTVWRAVVELGNKKETIEENEGFCHALQVENLYDSPPYYTIGGRGPKLNLYYLS